MLPVSESQNYTRLTATNPVTTNPGAVLGMFVSSFTGTPTISVLDGVNPIINLFVPTVTGFIPFPARFSTGLQVNIVGVADITVFWSP